VARLLKILQRLVDQGNTAIIIEHNLEVIKSADWITDLGLEGGAGGGRLLFSGTPEECAAFQESYTGRFLAPVLHQDSGFQLSPVELDSGVA